MPIVVKPLPGAATLFCGAVLKPLARSFTSRSTTVSPARWGGSGAVVGTGTGVLAFTAVLLMTVTLS